jgi:hypothetical protein
MSSRPKQAMMSSRPKRSAVEGPWVPPDRLIAGRLARPVAHSSPVLKSYLTNTVGCPTLVAHFATGWEAWNMPRASHSEPVPQGSRISLRLRVSVVKMCPRQAGADPSL